MRLYSHLADAIAATRNALLEFRPPIRVYLASPYQMRRCPSLEAI
jgi:hypothetical protein